MRFSGIILVVLQTARSVVGVSYKPLDANEDENSQYKEFGATNPASSSGAVSAVIRYVAVF